MATAAHDGVPWLADISAMNVASMFTAVPTHSMSFQSKVCIGTSPRQRRAKNECERRWFIALESKLTRHLKRLGLR